MSNGEDLELLCALLDLSRAYSRRKDLSAGVMCECSGVRVTKRASIFLNFLEVFQLGVRKCMIE